VADVDDVDVWRFESVVEDALTAATPEERLALSDGARTLWTSTPYADCDSRLVLAETVASRICSSRCTNSEPPR
jgi:hypothetical protein